MAKIAEFVAPVEGIKPQERGVEANAQLARTQARYGDQIAQGLRQEGNEIASGIDFVGGVAKEYQDKANKAADLAEHSDMSVKASDLMLKQQLERNDLFKKPDVSPQDISDFNLKSSQEWKDLTGTAKRTATKEYLTRQGSEVVMSQTRQNAVEYGEHQKNQIINAAQKVDTNFIKGMKDNASEGEFNTWQTKQEHDWDVEKKGYDGLKEGEQQVLEEAHRKRMNSNAEVGVEERLSQAGGKGSLSPEAVEREYQLMIRADSPYMKYADRQTEEKFKAMRNAEISHRKTAAEKEDKEEKYKFNQASGEAYRASLTSPVPVDGKQFLDDYAKKNPNFGKYYDIEKQASIVKTFDEAQALKGQGQTDASTLRDFMDKIEKNGQVDMYDVLKVYNEGVRGNKPALSWNDVQKIDGYAKAATDQITGRPEFKDSVKYLESVTGVGKTGPLGQKMETPDDIANYNKVKSLWATNYGDAIRNKTLKPGDLDPSNPNSLISKTIKDANLTPTTNLAVKNAINSALGSGQNMSQEGVPNTLVDHMMTQEGFKDKLANGAYRTEAGAKVAGSKANLSESEARSNLGYELKHAQNQVDQFQPNVPGGVKNALTSLTFNSGTDWQSAALGNAIKKGDYIGAKEKFLTYSDDRNSGKPTLAPRRAVEGKWFDDAIKDQISKMPKVTTPQEANKLAPGSRFVLPNGQIGRVPGGE